MYVWVPVCVYVPVGVGACRSQKRAANAWSWSDRLPDMGARTELASTGRTASAPPNHGAICPAPEGLIHSLLRSVFYEHALGARQRGVLRSPSDQTSKLKSVAPNPPGALVPPALISSMPLRNFHLGWCRYGYKADLWWSSLLLICSDHSLI